jgi:hypothetical protein
MNRWQAIEELFHLALQQDPGKRSAFLQEACAGDESLRREVESLLAYDKQAESFAESPPLEMAAERMVDSAAKPSCPNSPRSKLSGP